MYLRESDLLIRLIHNLLDNAISYDVFSNKIRSVYQSVWYNNHKYYQFRLFAMKEKQVSDNVIFALTISKMNLNTKLFILQNKYLQRSLINTLNF